MAFDRLNKCALLSCVKLDSNSRKRLLEIEFYLTATLPTIYAPYLVLSLARIRVRLVIRSHQTKAGRNIWDS